MIHQPRPTAPGWLRATALHILIVPRAQLLINSSGLFRCIVTCFLALSGVVVMRVVQGCDVVVTSAATRSCGFKGQLRVTQGNREALLGTAKPRKKQHPEQQGRGRSSIRQACLASLSKEQRLEAYIWGLRPSVRFLN